MGGKGTGDKAVIAWPYTTILAALGPRKKLVSITASRMEFSLKKENATPLDWNCRCQRITPSVNAIKGSRAKGTDPLKRKREERGKWRRKRHRPKRQRAMGRGDAVKKVKLRKKKKKKKKNKKRKYLTEQPGNRADIERWTTQEGAGWELQGGPGLKGLGA